MAREFSRERILYDRFHSAEFARPNLDTYLQRLYFEESELVVAFLSKDYDKNEWCGLEIRAIRSLIKRRRDDELMFLRLAQGEVSGVFDIDGDIDVQHIAANYEIEFGNHDARRE